MRLAPTLLATGAALAACTFLACHNSAQDEKPAAAAPAAAAPAAANSIQGAVLEVLPAPPYSYLRLKAAQGEIWAAVPAADIKVGAQVTLLVQVKMDKFQSTTLQRTFDAVYMGTLAGAAPAAPVAAAPAAPMAAPAAPAPGTGMAAAASAHGAPPATLAEKVGKAPGPDGHTVAELYAGKAALKDKPVAVRGKVMKYMQGIMGRTWIHLGDGTGSAQARNFDLVVTTADTTKVGEIVTLKGTLRVNKDIGSGYVYPVLLEDAKIVR